MSDPRYVLLPSVATRREAFDEYCRDRAREIRQQNLQKEKEVANPKAEYDKLLSSEVKSTRTSWSDFRRTWKKDRRFYGWGRDDREREKQFREYVKELGESTFPHFSLVGYTYLLSQRKRLKQPKPKQSFLNSLKSTILLEMLHGKMYVPTTDIELLHLLVALI